MEQRDKIEKCWQKLSKMGLNLENEDESVYEIGYGK